MVGGAGGVWGGELTNKEIPPARRGAEVSTEKN